MRHLRVWTTVINQDHRQLKEDKKNGFFGKVELASNAANRWNNNVMVNAFKDKRKLAAFSIMSSTAK
jgi:hypothetical protein